MTRFRTVVAMLATVTTMSLSAQEAKRLTPAQITPAETGAALGEELALWPTVAKNQVRRATVRSEYCEAADCGSLPTEDADPTSSGNATWTLCKTNSACSVIVVGACYTKAYSSCQDRVKKETGDPCQAC